MNSRLALLNALMLVAIIVMGYLVATFSSNEHSSVDDLISNAAPPASTRNATGGAAPLEDTSYDPGENAVQVGIQDVKEQFPNFGAKPLFKTIIPKPTPKPTPTPTPVPTPALEDIFKGWQLVNLGADKASFIIEGKNEPPFELQVGGEPLRYPFADGNVYEIKLVKVDLTSFKAILGTDKHQETFSLGMW